MSTKKTKAEEQDDALRLEPAEEPVVEGPPPVIGTYAPGVDPNYVAAHQAPDAAPAVSLLVWAARRGQRPNRLAGFRHWASANAPGDHTLAGWDAHFAKFSSTPVL